MRSYAQNKAELVKTSVVIGLSGAVNAITDRVNGCTARVDGPVARVEADPCYELAYS